MKSIARKNKIYRATFERISQFGQEEANEKEILDFSEMLNEATHNPNHDYNKMTAKQVKDELRDMQDPDYLKKLGLFENEKKKRKASASPSSHSSASCSGSGSPFSASCSGSSSSSSSSTSPPPSSPLPPAPLHVPAPIPPAPSAAWPAFSSRNFSTPNFQNSLQPLANPSPLTFSPSHNTFERNSGYFSPASILYQSSSSLSLVSRSAQTAASSAAVSSEKLSKALPAAIPSSSSPSSSSVAQNPSIYFPSSPPIKKKYSRNTKKGKNEKE